MNMKSEVIRRTLMCKDVPVVDFAYDPLKHIVIWKSQPKNLDFAPIGTIEPDGTLSRTRLTSWILLRGIPDSRPYLKEVSSRLGSISPDEIMLSMYGLSLSDQFWFKPIDDTSTRWADINFFSHGFSEQLGLALAGPDESSERAIKELRRDGLMASSTPDSALCGNLPKRWVIDDGERLLIKSGKIRNYFQEPLNEAIATELCSRILLPEDYVPYKLVANHQFRPMWLSACPCMVDASHELVSAHDVIRAWKCDNSRSRYENFVDACLAHGIVDVRTSLSKMLVVDHIMANWDRHWGNFGVIVNSDTRQWERVAPLYDMGESLWCDRAATGDLSTPYRPEYPMPFLRDIRRQLGRFADSLDWFVPEKLEGFAGHVREALSVKQFLTYDEEWLSRVEDKVRERISETYEATENPAPKRLSVYIERGISLEEAVGRGNPSPGSAKAQERTRAGRGQGRPGGKGL